MSASGTALRVKGPILKQLDILVLNQVPRKGACWIGWQKAEQSVVQYSTLDIALSLRLSGTKEQSRWRKVKYQGVIVVTTLINVAMPFLLRNKTQAVEYSCV